MKKVHFYLREGKSKRKTIYLCIRKGKNDSYKKSLNFQILPSEWNKEKMRMRTNSGCRDSELINTYLNNMESEIIHFFNEMHCQKKEITLADIKSFVLKYMYPERSMENNFLAFLKNYMIRLDKRPSYTTGKPLKRSTVDKFHILYRLLREYGRIYKTALNFRDIDLMFYNNFITFLRTKGYATNTIGKYIRAMKCVLNDAAVNGFAVNPVYKNPQFKAFNEETESVYLTKNDLNKIIRADLPASLDDSRKLFLIGCYTGLRYSDFSRITADNVSHERINIVQKKTGQPVVIPVHTSIKNIISEINQIKVVSNAALNKNIKSICKIAGLNDKIISNFVRGGDFIRR